MAANSPNRASREAAGAASRVAAGELLFTVVQTGADMETALGAVSSYARLQGPDRAFARAIASAALRGLGRIDYALGGLVDRPLEQVEAPLRALLRAGCAQLWLMGVAEHAAVSATVDAAREWRAARRGGGLINAVLRRAASEAGREAFASAPATSVWPDWLAARIRAALGEAQADALALLQLDEPPTDLTSKPGLHPETLAERSDGEALANGSVRLPGGAVLADLPGYASGDWWVQDAGASVAAKLMGDVSGLRVADLCAAPGGKALQLATAGARLTAIDISRQRLALVHENAERVGAGHGDHRGRCAPVAAGRAARRRAARCAVFGAGRSAPTSRGRMAARSGRARPLSQGAGGSSGGGARDAEAGWPAGLLRLYAQPGGGA